MRKSKTLLILSCPVSGLLVTMLSPKIRLGLKITTICFGDTVFRESGKTIRLQKLSHDAVRRNTDPALKTSLP